MAPLASEPDRSVCIEPPPAAALHDLNTPLVRILEQAVGAILCAASEAASAGVPASRPTSAAPTAQSPNPRKPRRAALNFPLVNVI